MSDNPMHAGHRPPVRQARRCELAVLAAFLSGDQPFVGQQTRLVLRVYGEEAGESAVPAQTHFIDAVPHLQGTDVGATRPEYFGRGFAHDQSLVQEHVHEQVHTAGGRAASVPPQSASKSNSLTPNSWLDQTKSLAGSRIQGSLGLLRLAVTHPVPALAYTLPMTDDSLLWTHKPAPRCRPRPGEPLWSVQKGDVTWSAELRFHGEYSVEAQILRDGDLVIGRMFVLRDLAVGWAKNEQDRLGKDDPLL